MPSYMAWFPPHGNIFHSAVVRPAYRGGSSAPAWTPAELPGIIDYGVWSDLSRLISADGVNPVTTAGDPIRRWVGQLDAVYYENVTTATMPLYSSSGIRIGGSDVDASGKGFWDSNATFNIQDSHTHFDALVKGPADMSVSTVHETAASVRFSMYAIAPNASFYSRGASYSRAFDATLTTRRRVGISHVSGSVFSYIDGAKVSHGASGTSTGAITVRQMTAYNGNLHYSRAWVKISGAISDDDYALLDAWLETI